MQRGICKKNTDGTYDPNRVFVVVTGANAVSYTHLGVYKRQDMGRVDSVREGRIPRHTFRADIDYGTAEANTTFGVIGVKVWIYLGEVLPGQEYHAKYVAAEN